jgi:DMSO/TMAO reductase YedYZ molybdopterin-dependent catalytic subunit
VNGTKQARVQGRRRVERGAAPGPRARRAARLHVGAALVTAVVVGLAVLAAACGSGGQASSPSPAASGPVVLTVKGEKGSRTFTMGQLKALPAYEGYAGIKSSTGVITVPSKYKGVPLADLADLVGGISEESGVTIVAKDGYGMTFSYRQIMENGFTTYDPATGAEEPPSGKLHVIIAYQKDGKALGSDDGPLKLTVAEDTPAQVVDGHWAIKWLDGISVTKASANWKVQLQGAVPGEITRASYVNCASPGCHGSGWVDTQGQRWEGVPFYLVCGLVDGGKTHDAGAYDAKLAKKGYKIQIESEGGKVVTIDSRKIAGRNDIILSSKVDGGELPDEDFPLRLVGPELSEAQMPGGIARIVVRVK